MTPEQIANRIELLITRVRMALEDEDADRQIVLEDLDERLSRLANDLRRADSGLPYCQACQAYYTPGQHQHAGAEQ